MSALWILEELVALARYIEPNARARGWHVGVTGGVLYKGQSDHDGDIVAFPHQRGRCARKGIKGLHQALRASGLSLSWSRKDLTKNWRKRGITDRKWVEIWADVTGRRVDVLVLA